MPQVLKLHPDSRAMNDILVPPVAAATRSDDLWQHTCFEAFVRAPSDAEYYEFNFAPSTQWAAYRFSGYRRGMHVANEIDPPQIEVQAGPQSCTLRASLDLGRLPALARTNSWQCGLSALIEDTGGRKSYWALAHPPGKPDFHHAEAFALELSPAASS
jgi:hypothetical protein